MDEKPHNSGLGGHISSPIKYDPNMHSASTAATAEMEKTRTELDDFKKKLVKKFPFTMALSVLPVQSFKAFEEEDGLLPEEVEKKPLHLLMIIPEEEFKNIPKKIKPEVVKLVQESKQNLWVHIKTPVDIWNYGLDSKYDLVDAVGGSYPLHDKGFLGALRVASIHKTLVLKKFEKYVASYVIFGSLVRGAADKESDVDTFVIIDDTDVKRMPRVQLLEKLRGIIYDYIREASALAGVKNLLNVQVSLMTDFWQRVKDAEPVVFTFIRDGVPMHDRGTFLPWKLLLQMGKIKPSPEAVDQFMKYGEQNKGLVNRRMIDAMVDIYWGIVTPTQALVMLAGEGPEVPKNLVAQVKRIFVDKEKIMGMKELKILEKVVKMYKDHEHGTLKEIPGKDIDVLLKDAEEYDMKLKELRKKLEQRVNEHSADAIDNEVFDLLKKILGNKSKEALVKEFEKELVNKGKVQKKFVPVLKDVASIKQKVKTKKMSHSEMDIIRRSAAELVDSLTEYSQRKEFVAMEKSAVRVNYGSNSGELILTDSNAFFVAGGIIKKISHGKVVESNNKEFEEALSKSKADVKQKVSGEVLAALKKELGEYELVF